VSGPGGVDDDGPGRALPEVEAALGKFVDEPRAVDRRVPCRQARRSDVSELDASPGLDQPFARRHRCHRLFGVDQAVRGHPLDDVVSAFLRQAIGDRPGVRRRRWRQAEPKADHDVHVGPPGEILRDVHRPAIRTDQAIRPVLVSAIVLDVLGAAVRLMLQAELNFEGAPPGGQDGLAIGSVRRRVRVNVIDRTPCPTMSAAGDDLAQLGVQVLASGHAPGLDHLGDLTLFRFEQMRAQGAAAFPWRGAGNHWPALRLI
jgi:hypothetical protein